MSYFKKTLFVFFAALLCLSSPAFQNTVFAADSAGLTSIKYVFVIAEENHNLDQIKGNPSAPYINFLLKIGSHAENYNTPKGLHPSAPNLVWLETGSEVAGKNDCSPINQSCATDTNMHFTNLLDNAHISWKAYVEGASGNECILESDDNLDVNHVPFSYFLDVTGNNNLHSQKCISHERPFSELANDLSTNSVAQYNFIVPDKQNDMHDGTVKQADSWLSREVPKILNSKAYKDNGLLIILWDEGKEIQNGQNASDGPIPFILLSPKIKVGYSNNIYYTHSSTLKSIQEIFGVDKPLLGDAANANDLSDFFVADLQNKGAKTAPSNNKVGKSPDTGTSIWEILLVFIVIPLGFYLSRFKV